MVHCSVSLAFHVSHLAAKLPNPQVGKLVIKHFDPLLILLKM